jgi:glycosyltransferase involved in cell wall biosynthesis
VPTDRQPHVVLIVLGFPPSSGSGAYRGLGFANHLVDLGWKVTVLTVTEDFFDLVTHARDDSLLPLVDERVRVERVPMRMQHLVGDYRAWGAFRGNFRQVHDDLWRLLQRHAFPERYAGWIPGLVRALRRLHKEDPVDVVLASGNPWSAFAAAWALHRLKGVPYVMDYRDAWTLDQFSGEPAFAPGDPAWRWERRLVRDAARVIFVNEGMREWYAARYPEAADVMRVVPNGYDPEVVGDIPFRAPVAGAPLRFGYVGTVTEVLPHEVVWKAWELVREKLPDAEFDIYGRLGFFARSAKRLRAMLPDPSTSGVHFRGPVAKSGIGEVYGSLDVLVLLIPGSRYVTTGKVFENLAVGKPVVLACEPDSDAVTVSRGHPLVHAVDELTPEAVAEALLAAAEQARRTTPQQAADALEHARIFERGRLVARAAAELEQVRRHV